MGIVRMYRLMRLRRKHLRDAKRETDTIVKKYPNAKNRYKPGMKLPTRRDLDFRMSAATRGRAMKTAPDDEPSYWMYKEFHNDKGGENRSQSRKAKVWSFLRSRFQRTRIAPPHGTVTPEQWRLHQELQQTNLYMDVFDLAKAGFALFRSQKDKISLKIGKKTSKKDGQSAGFGGPDQANQSEHVCT